MEQYNVIGMSCAACVARVEKAVNSVEGVTSCAVNLLTNSMGVEGTASAQDIIQAVTDAGYGASLKNAGKKSSQADSEDSLKDTETPKMKKRLVASVLLLIPLMYVSMGHMLWNWPLPSFLNGNHVAMGIYELLISGLIMVINQKFFISGFKGLFHRSPNMDTLVALGATASFGYSVYALFAMTDSVLHGNHEQVMYFMDQFYFESAATILTLITIGKTLESYSKGKTTNALKSLMKLAPKTAVILKDGKEIEVEIEKVQVGDKFVVRPGDNIPVDGVVLEGESAVDESALTGESIPVEKNPGQQVSASTINTSGFLVCKATRVGEDTTLAGIIRMVSESAGTKAPIAKIADKVSGVFVPAVISIALITFTVWLLTGQSAGYALSRAVSVLVISCPCALGLATPVAIMVGNGTGARNGILFKTSESLEQTGKAKFVVLDKTGTITEGKPYVIGINPEGNISEKELLKAACILENQSEHPLAKAVVEYGKKEGIEIHPAEKFEAVSGKGVKALVNGIWTYGGNKNFILSNCPEITQGKIDAASSSVPKGVTPLFFATENDFLGIILAADTIKSDSKLAISELTSMGLEVFMLTGDNKQTASYIAEQAGIKTENIISEVLPGDKADNIKKLQEKGKVIMVGDGINDAPALTQADTGIAIGDGTDIAIDAAEIVLMKNSLMKVTDAVKLSRATIRNIHENLFWAFIYNAIGIPLAAGCFIKLFGWTLNPMFGAAAMGLSSFCVVSNALRLNFVRLYKDTQNHSVQNPESKKDFQEKIINSIQEKTMKITVKGMMCGHCEGHVKKALEAIEGIESAVPSHEENLVTITTSKEVDEALIKAAVTEAGYEYEGIIG
ncbi:MAG: heavy metal translocating P-type ATPase [Spirochaetales bacterium]|nr:heavy metal translocating P-type ATPase [Spirochaetales bacterium]